MAAKSLAVEFPKFSDVHTELGLEFRFNNWRRGRNLMVESTGGGGAWLDFDADGYPDAVFAQGCDPDRIQRAVKAAEAADDSGAVAIFLSLALDGAAGRMASEVVRLGWMRRLAEIHKSQGDLGEAIRRHRAILQQWPLDADAYAGLHRCYADLEDWGSLAELIRTHIGLLETASNTPEVRLRREWSELLTEKLKVLDLLF